VQVHGRRGGWFLEVQKEQAKKKGKQEKRNPNVNVPGKKGQKEAETLGRGTKNPGPGDEGWKENGNIKG